MGMSGVVPQVAVKAGRLRTRKEPEYHGHGVCFDEKLKHINNVKIVY